MQMVDVSSKDVTRREAVAEGKVYLKPSVIVSIKKKRIPKGDVLEAAKIAGILSAKKTPSLIPLCHPLLIEYIEVKFFLARNYIKIIAAVKGRAKTGFEMEALVAVSIAGLTIYDMCKPLDKGIVISDVKLLKKSGGKSGTYVRE